MQQNVTTITPEDFDAVLFDMDGVVTRTAAVHFAAWKKIFDDFLQKRENGNFKEFTQQDYLAYVDGKPREDGVSSFLESRGIKLESGKLNGSTKGNGDGEKDQRKEQGKDQGKDQSKDRGKDQSKDKRQGGGHDSGSETVESLARNKDKEFLHLIHTEGVEPYETTISLIQQLRNAGVKTALVTASRNGAEILRVTNTSHLFDATVTGIDAKKLKLQGKPAPDVFLEAAHRLGVEPARAIVVEDADAGVQSGKNGHFGKVIGVARQSNETALKEHGADCVVRDLAEVVVPQNANKDNASLRGMALSDLDVTEANWVVVYDHYDPEHEQQRESLCSLGNGKFCTRGAAFDARADKIHYPGCYVAGGYNLIPLDLDGGPLEREELVNMPNWLSLTFRIEDGEWFSIDKVELLSYNRTLNLREGILYRDIHFRDSAGRETNVSERRFVHMKYSHLAGIEIQIVPINWSGSIVVRSGIDGSVRNGGDPIDPKLEGDRNLRTLIAKAHEDIIVMKVITTNSKLVVAEAARTVVSHNGDTIDARRETVSEDDFIAQDIFLTVEQDESVTIQKTCSLYTSRDRGIYEPEVTATEAASGAPPFDELCEAQVDAWKSLWRQFDLFIETSEEYSKLVPSLLLHLNSFHCLQTASTHTVDLDNGVPARGWTGEEYQGHVFWDDLFVFPFINLRMPNISQALLKYRYRRLGEARKIASSCGARGACFPWQSASDGKERTPSYWWMPANQQWVKDHTHLQRHVNGAIAYNVWQYYEVTTDNNFMYSYGSEILLEIARFFASYAQFNPGRERYEIHGVMGPDEFHNSYPDSKSPGINNNAYTNLLATWTLSRALELLEKLPADHSQHLRCRLDIGDDEVKLWTDISHKMFVPIMKNGLVAQFEGYEDLEEFPGRKNNKIDRAELTDFLKKNEGNMNKYKLSKQADVLMLGFLFSPDELKVLIERLGYPEDCVALDRIADYYIPRTSNDSTLSRVAHAWVLSRLGRILTPEQLGLLGFNAKEEDQVFYEALGSDYFDVASRGTTKSGIHMGAMAGTVDIVQRCYTGIVTRDDVLWLDPMLPGPLVRLSFNMQYRGQSLGFDIHQDKMQIFARHSTARQIKIGYADQIYELNAGDTKVIKLLPRKDAGDAEKPLAS